MTGVLNLTVLHHGVTQPVLHPSVGTRLVMHGEADVSGTVKTGHGLLLLQGGASDEVGASGHDVRFVVHATIIGTGSDHFRAMVDTLPTGRAADQFVSLSGEILADSITQDTN